MQRTKDYRRKKNYAKALRRRNIDVSKSGDGEPMYKHLGQYIKGKIHCSCPLCRAKSKGNNWKHSDATKIDSMRSEMAECLAS